MLPKLFAKRSSDDPVRAWVAGCATGEEAYSVGILLQEQTALHAPAPHVQVFASDIDARAITAARANLYPAGIRTDVTPTRLRQFFKSENDHFRVVKAVRDTVLFSIHNLLRDPPFANLELISCRNVLIYLDREAQARVLDAFRFALRPGGFLFLGNSESIETAANAFTVVDKKSRIYRMNEARATKRPVPAGAPIAVAAPEPRQRTKSKAQNAKAAQYAELHVRALGQFAPPSVLVDAEGNILHLSEGAGRFLVHASGAPTHNLLAVVHPDLKLEVRTTLFKANHSGASAVAAPVAMRRNGEEKFVRIAAHPFRDLEADAGMPLTLVVFDAATAPAPLDTKAVDDRGRASHRRSAGERNPESQDRSAGHDRAVRRVHRGIEGLERRAAVDQRGVAIGHRGARDRQGGTAVGQRGAIHGQLRAQGQGRRDRAGSTTICRT